MNTSLSLKVRFAGILAVTIITLTLIISLVIGWRSSGYVKKEIGDSLAETAFHMSDKLDQYMWARSGEITVLSQLETLRSGDNPANIEALLNGLKKSFPSFSWIGVTDSQGKVVAGTNGILVGVDIAKRPVHIEGMKGQFIGDVHDAVLLAKLLPNPSGEPMKFVDVSTPVLGYDGEKRGVLAAHLSWEWVAEIQRSIMEPLRDRSNMDIFIVSYTDSTILLGPKEMIGQQLTLESVSLARQGNNNWRVEIWPDGKEYLTGYSFGKGYMDYPGLGWSVLVRQPVELAFAPVSHLQSFILLIGGIFAALFAGVGWFFAGSVTRPLAELAKVADRLRFGERSEVPEQQGIKEMEILSSSLRHLADSLSDTESALGQMSLLAHHDRLTNLPNRIGLDKFLEVAAACAGRKKMALTFLYLDLDGFKGVNDSMGHPAGDLLLIEVAGRLKNSVREEEIAARLGGDEFLIVLNTGSENAHELGQLVAQRIIKALNVPFLLEGKTAKVGCSIGGASWPADSQDIKEVIALADQALYQAKRSGKNCVVFSGISGVQDAG